MALTPYGADMSTSDVMFLVGQSRFYANRKRLAEKSTYFQAMFNSDMKECNADIIELKDIEPGVFQTLLNYCYNNSFKVTEDNAHKLLLASSMYDFGEIQENCIQFLDSRLDATNCLEIMLLADSTSIRSLHLAAKQMSLWDFDTIRHEQEILELPEEILISYLSQDDIRVESEVNVFETIACWVSYDEPNRANHFESLLTLVRFSNTTVDEVERMLHSPSLGRCDCNCVTTRVKKIIRTVKQVKIEQLGPVQVNDGGLIYAEGKDCSTEDDESVKATSPFGNDVNCLEVSKIDVDEIESNSDIQDREHASRLLLTAPRAIRYVPAVVANFPCGSTDMTCAPCLAYYNFAERALVYQDTITKALQNSHVAMGFRACIVGKYVYVTGGEFFLGHNNWNFSVWKYDIFSRKWSFVTRLPNQRRNHILCVVDECIYFIGGLGRFRIVLNTADKLNTITGQWTDVPPLPEAVINAVCACYCNKIYVLSTYVYCYCTLSCSWSHLKGARLPHEYDFHSAIPHQDGIFLLGRASNKLVKFRPENLDAGVHRGECFECVGEFTHASDFACIVGSVIYAFNTEETLLESYNTSTGEFRIEDANDWSDTLGVSDTCYGCFPMPHYVL